MSEKKECCDIKLSKGQKVDYVNLRKAENGVVLSYTIKTETANNSQTGWEDKTEVFSSEKADEAVERAAMLLKMQAGIE